MMKPDHFAGHLSKLKLASPTNPGYDSFRRTAILIGFILPGVSGRKF